YGTSGDVSLRGRNVFQPELEAFSTARQGFRDPVTIRPVLPATRFPRCYSQSSTSSRSRSSRRALPQSRRPTVSWCCRYWTRCWSPHELDGQSRFWRPGLPRPGRIVDNSRTCMAVPDLVRESIVAFGRGDLDAVRDMLGPEGTYEVQPESAGPG